MRAAPIPSAASLTSVGSPIRSGSRPTKAKSSPSIVPGRGWNVISCSTRLARYPVSSSSSRRAASAGSSSSSTSPPGRAPVNLPLPERPPPPHLATYRISHGHDANAYPINGMNRRGLAVAGRQLSAAPFGRKSCGATSCRARRPGTGRSRSPPSRPDACHTSRARPCRSRRARPCRGADGYMTVRSSVLQQ